MNAARRPSGGQGGDEAVGQTNNSLSPATSELWVLTRVGAGRRQYSDLYLTKRSADRAAQRAGRAGRTVFVSRLRCGVAR